MHIPILTFKQVPAKYYDDTVSNSDSESDN